MTYLFYDYETTGINEKYDQIVQFAAIRTNENFDIIQEPFNILCKIRNDIIPSPYSFLITKIDIENLQENGLCEYDFAKKVHKIFTEVEDQCIIGYNSKEFDDKMSRFLFYRNFHHPYSWSYENNNKTWDLIDIVRLGYSFNKLPDINFKYKDKDTLKLENLSKINNISHTHAHDALSDVYATIELMQLIKKHNNNLLIYYSKLDDYLHNYHLITQSKLFFHISAYYGYDNNFTSLHTPICTHPYFNKSMISWDLSKNPTTLLSNNIDKILENKFLKKNDKIFEDGFTEIKLNQNPTILKYTPKTIHPKLNLDDYLKNYEIIKTNKNLLKNLALEYFKIEIQKEDPDADLYLDNYFDDYKRDKQNLNKLLTDPINFNVSSFKSTRFKEQILRLKGRNFYNELNPDEKAEYDSYVLDKIENNNPDVKWMTKNKFNQEYQEIITQNPDINQSDINILNKLKNYVQSL